MFTFADPASNCLQEGMLYWEIDLGIGPKCDKFPLNKQTGHENTVS